jgi:hypothetical protein
MISVRNSFKLLMLATAGAIAPNASARKVGTAYIHASATTHKTLYRTHPIGAVKP